MIPLKIPIILKDSKKCMRTFLICFDKELSRKLKKAARIDRGGLLGGLLWGMHQNSYFICKLPLTPWRMPT